MKPIHPMKRKKAFRMRVEGHTIADVARECHLAKDTVQRLENGYVDRRGVRRPGWKEELERLKHEQDRAEFDCAAELREERLKAFRRLATMAIEKIETQFPNIVMKSTTDYKALCSEARELHRILREESGNGKSDDAPSISIKADVTFEQAKEAFDASRQVDVDDVTPPRHGREERELSEPEVLEEDETR